MIGYVAAGMIISIASFFAALAYLYAFARDRYGDDVAVAIWLLAAYPFAIFFGALYTESLFLLGTAGAFYHFSKQQFGRAACWGLLVGLTRVNGALLVLPLGPAGALVLGLAIEREGASPPRRRPALGLVIYALFIWRPHRQSARLLRRARWRGDAPTRALGTLVSHQYSILANAGLSGYVGTPGYDVLNAIGAIFAIATIWPVTRRLGAAYGLFMALNVFPALADGGLLSAGRLSSVLFPAFIWLATAVPSSQRPGWIATFAAMQAFGAALFYTWRPLF